MYSRIEIQKNLDMTRICVDECLSKLHLSLEDAKLLEERIEVTLALVDFVRGWMKDISDEYLGNVMVEINGYIEKFKEYKINNESKNLIVVSD